MNLSRIQMKRIQINRIQNQNPTHNKIDATTLSHIVSKEAYMSKILKHYPSNYPR